MTSSKWQSIKRRLWLTALSALLASACSDDEKNNGPEQRKPHGAAADGKIGNSDPEAVVDSLNDAEWAAACADMAAATATREFKHGQCIIGALPGTLIGVDCQETYDLCTRGDSDLNCDAKPVSCNVTLRQLDSCVSAQMLWLSEHTQHIDCQSPWSALLSIPQDQYAPECAALRSACPSALESSRQEEEWELLQSAAQGR